MPKARIIAVLVFSILAGAWLYSEAPKSEEPTPQSKEIRWMVAHSPSRYFLRAADRFSKILAEEAPSVKVRVLANPDSEPVLDEAPSEHPEWWGDTALGRDEQFDLRSLSEGLLLDGSAVNMMQVYTSDLARSSRQFAVLDTPGLFRDYEHIEAVVEGPIGQRMLDSMGDSKLKPLAFTFSGGFMSYMSYRKPLSSLDDLEDGSCRIFVNNESEVVYETCRRMGLTPVVVRNEQGNVPGPFDYMRLGLADFIEVNYEDAARYLRKEGVVLLHTRHRVLFTALVINREFFDALSPSEQKAVKEAATLAAREERQSFVEAQHNLENSAELKNSIHQLSSADQRRMQELAQQMQIDVATRIDPALIVEIKAAGL